MSSCKALIPGFVHDAFSLAVPTMAQLEDFYSTYYLRVVFLIMLFD